jgi:hypothetical protein
VEKSRAEPVPPFLFAFVEKGSANASSPLGRDR